MELKIKIDDEEIKSMVMDSIQRAIFNALEDNDEGGRLSRIIKREIKQVILDVTKEKRQELEDLVVKKSVDALVQCGKSKLFKELLK